jgi:D-methionine transport system substrate-binding protein
MLRRYFYILFLIILPFQFGFADEIKIGVIAGPSVDILKLVQKIAKEKYNIQIKPVVFMDYIMPNEALSAGDLDLNIFQTQAFLEESILKRNYRIKSIGRTFIYPMGIYSKKIDHLSQLKDHAIVAIPNDLSNEARALLLLNAQGVIRLKMGNGIFVTQKDIIQNPKNIKIMTIDSAQLARVTQDADLVLLNNDFVLNAGFQPSQALAVENPRSAAPYVNVIVAADDKVKNEDFKKIISIYHSDEVLNKTLLLYPSAVKAW